MFHSGTVDYMTTYPKTWETYFYYTRELKGRNRVDFHGKYTSLGGQPNFLRALRLNVKEKVIQSPNPDFFPTFCGEPLRRREENPVYVRFQTDEQWLENSFYVGPYNPILIKCSSDLLIPSHQIERIYMTCTPPKTFLTDIPHKIHLTLNRMLFIFPTPSINYLRGLLKLCFERNI